MAKVSKSKANKAMKTLRRVKKDLKGRNGNPGGRRNNMRRNATYVLAQGAVSVPKRNFGTGMCNSSKLSSLIKCLDARIPRTLGLPRAVGPYTVIRTTRLFSTNSKFVMFCPFYRHDEQKWYDWCGIQCQSGVDDITGASKTTPINMPMLGLGEACEVVPAAMTVQVMNANSLQTADGVFAMGRVNQQLSLGSSPSGLTYNEIAARFVSFYSPRLLTGGKLALRGVKCNSYPLDMNEYAKFSPVIQFTGNITWSNNDNPSALAPIVFVNENEKGMEFMVTIEWRVRFDPGNPATSSHTYHDVLKDDLWNNVVKAASAAGHGVEELAEEVANAGEAVEHAI